MADLIIDVSAEADQSPWDPVDLLQSNYGSTDLVNGEIRQNNDSENMVKPAGHVFGASRFIEITSSGGNWSFWTDSGRQMEFCLEYTDAQNNVRVTTTHNGTDQERFYIRRYVDGVATELAYSGNLTYADLEGVVTMKFEAVESGGLTTFAIYHNGVQKGATQPAASFVMSGMPAVTLRHGESSSLDPTRLVFGGYVESGKAFIARLESDLYQYTQNLGIRVRNMAETADTVTIGGEACTIASQVGEIVTVERAPGNLIPNPLRGNVVAETVAVTVSGATKDAEALFLYTKTHHKELPAPGEYSTNSWFGASGIKFPAGTWANFPGVMFHAATGEEIPILFKSPYTTWEDVPAAMLTADVNAYLWAPHGFTGVFEAALDLLLPDGAAPTVTMTFNIEAAA